MIRNFVSEDEHMKSIVVNGSTQKKSHFIVQNVTRDSIKGPQKNPHGGTVMFVIAC